MSELENVTNDEVNLVMNGVYEFARGTSYTEEWRMTRHLFSMIANLPNDLESGRSIALRDPRASRVCTGYEPWTSLNMRLAEVGGSWFRVGMTMFHNRTAVGPDDVGRLGGLYITDIVRETIGIGASCAESVAPVSILGGPEPDGRTDEGTRRPFDTLR